LHSLAYGLLIEDGEGSGLTCAHFADVAVWLIAKAVRRTAEQLGFGVEFAVDF
jgi:hypothetical protein